MPGTARTPRPAARNGRRTVASCLRGKKAPGRPGQPSGRLPVRPAHAPRAPFHNIARITGCVVEVVSDFRRTAGVDRYPCGVALLLPGVRDAPRPPPPAALPLTRRYHRSVPCTSSPFRRSAAARISVHRSPGPVTEAGAGRSGREAGAGEPGAGNGPSAPVRRPAGTGGGLVPAGADPGPGFRAPGGGVDAVRIHGARVSPARRKGRTRPPRTVTVQGAAGPGARPWTGAPGRPGSAFGHSPTVAPR